MYREYSNKLYNLLLNYTDEIERYSIDECFLDMTKFLMKSTLEEKAIEIFAIGNRIIDQVKKSRFIKKSISINTIRNIIINKIGNSQYAL